MQQAKIQAFVDELRSLPIAIQQTAANKQHYEVPTSYFLLCLGKHLKYSCCLYPGLDAATPLDDAEEAMLSASPMSLQQDTAYISLPVQLPCCWWTAASVCFGAVLLEKHSLRALAGLSPSHLHFQVRRICTVGANKDYVISVGLCCERAELADGQDVLELGCGWGSLCLFVAARYPRSRVTAVSNSRTQRELIEARATQWGLSNLEVITADVVTFETVKRFDRVVSVEMFEHMKNYEARFCTLPSCNPSEL